MNKKILILLFSIVSLVVIVMVANYGIKLYNINADNSYKQKALNDAIEYCHSIMKPYNNITESLSEKNCDNPNAYSISYGNHKFSQ